MEPAGSTPGDSKDVEWKPQTVRECRHRVRTEAPGKRRNRPSPPLRAVMTGRLNIGTPDLSATGAGRPIPINQHPPLT